MKAAPSHPPPEARFYNEGAATCASAQQTLGCSGDLVSLLCSGPYRAHYLMGDTN